MNVELFSRIKTLQVEQMSVKRGPRPFLKIWKGGPSNFLIIWTKKMFMSFSWNKVCTFEMSVSQKARDQRTSKLSCHVQSRKVGHIQSQDFVKYKSQLLTTHWPSLKVTKRGGQRKSFKGREKATEKAKFCILQNLCE